MLQQAEFPEQQDFWAKPKHDFVATQQLAGDTSRTDEHSQSALCAAKGDTSKTNIAKYVINWRAKLRIFLIEAT